MEILFFRADVAVAQRQTNGNIHTGPKAQL